MGAGVAGAFAALEAARMGADVTIYDSSDRLPTLRSSWPPILSGGEARRLLNEAVLSRNGVRLNLAERVSGLASAALTSRGGYSRFDSLIVATGSGAAGERLLGLGRSGTHVLDREAAFYELRDSLGNHSAFVVTGSGLMAAAVADALAVSGANVSLLSPSGPFSSQVSPGPRGVLLRAARDRGVRIVDSAPWRVVGVGRVEALITAETVMPCDAFLVVPKLRPSLPPSNLVIGRGGGIAVDQFASTSARGVYAAGDCAEVVVGSGTLPLTSESAAMATGRVAGANAAGARFATRAANSFACEVFGTSICISGLTLALARGCGFDALEYSKVWDEALACSLVVEAGTLTLLGAQVAGRNARMLADSLSTAVSQRMNLRELAYLESPGSTDISPTSGTATEALTELATACAGSGLRPR